MPQRCTASWCQLNQIDLDRSALGRLGLVEKGDECDRRPSQDELDRIFAALDIFHYLRLRDQCEERGPAADVAEEARHQEVYDHCLDGESSV